MICSSVVTCPCPDEPQSLEGPETLAQATYHLPAVIGTGFFLNMIGYFCLLHIHMLFSQILKEDRHPLLAHHPRFQYQIALFYLHTLLFLQKVQILP